MTLREIEGLESIQGYRIMKLAIKKVEAVFWKTDLSVEDIQKMLQTGKITEEWLVCPQDEVGDAVLISEFLANPSIFKSNSHEKKDESKKKPKKTEPKENDRGTWSMVLDSYRNDWKVMLGKFEGVMTNPDDIEDLNRRGAYLHVLADALVSVMVILALLFGMLNPSAFSILDPLIGIVAGAVIARWAVGLLIDSRNQLLEIN